MYLSTSQEKKENLNFKKNYDLTRMAVTGSVIQIISHD